MRRPLRSWTNLLGKLGLRVVEKPANHSRRRLTQRQFAVETLEDRSMMATLYWDTNGATPGFGGAGTWSTTAANWTTDPTGSTATQAWNNAAGDEAVFKGTGVAVTVGSGIQASSLKFETSGYTLSGGTLSVSGTGEIQVNSGTATITTPLTGSTELLKTGTGTLTLSGNNSISGGSKLVAGTLQVNHDSALGSGTVALAGGKLQAGNGARTLSNAIFAMAATTSELVSPLNNNLTLNGNVSGTGTIWKTGSGNVALGGDNTAFAGTLSHRLGQVYLNSPASGSVQATWDITGGDAIAVNFAGEGTVQLGAISGNTGRFTAAQAFTGTKTFEVGALNLDTSVGGIVSNSGTGGTLVRLVKKGTGTLTLNGSNTYTGGTSIEAGTLQLGSGGTTGSLSAGNITNDATLVFNRSDNSTIANAISGLGSLTKLGAGVLTLTGNNTYSGTTTIDVGTLQIGSGGTTGSLGSGSVNNYGTLIFNRSDITTVANVISGSGSFIKSGTGALTVTANNTFSGGSRLAAGTLQVDQDSALGTGMITLAGGKLQAGNGSRTLSNTLFAAAATTSDLIAPIVNDLTLTGSLTGTGTIRKTGAASVYLAGDNTAFAGAFSHRQGNLFLNSANSGSSLTAWDITGGDLLGLNFTGSGSVQFGSFAGTTGRLVSNVLDGNKTIEIGSLNTSTSYAGTIQNHVTNSTDSIVSVIKVGSGTLTLSGQNTFTGDLRINAGTLNAAKGNNTTNPTQGALGNAQATRDVIVESGATLRFSASDTLGGAGSTPITRLVVNGGTVTNNGAQFTTLGEVLLNGGTLTGTGGASSNYQIYRLGGTVTATANSTISGTGTNAGIHLATPTTFDVASGVTLEVSAKLLNKAPLSTVVATSLRKIGSGTLVLSADNSYSGGTIVEAGTLQVGNGGTTGTVGGGEIAIQSNFVINRSNEFTINNKISGTGTLSQNGTGTSIIAGSSKSFQGTSVVNSGTLQIDAFMNNPVTVNGGLLTGEGGTGNVTNYGGVVDYETYLVEILSKTPALGNAGYTTTGLISYLVGGSVPVFVQALSRGDAVFKAVTGYAYVADTSTNYVVPGAAFKWVADFVLNGSSKGPAITMEDKFGRSDSDEDYDDRYFKVSSELITIDIDVDSDNDGTIDPDNNGNDDPIEENDPGQVIAWNSDDDDQNGITDFRQETSVEGENDLAEVLLSNNFENVLSKEGMRLKLSSQDDTVRVYLSPNKTGLLNLSNGKFWKLDGSEAPPAKVYVEGLKFGKATLHLELVDGGNSVVEYDTVVLHVVGADLDGDSNDNGFIDPDNTINGSDDRIEENAPGVSIEINYDDDDGNGVADIAQQGPIIGENDLVKLELDYLVPPGDDRTYELVFSSQDTNKIKVYKKQDKSGILDLSTDPRITVTGAATDPKEIWVEGIAPGTATITLQFYQSGGAYLTTDKLVVTVKPPKLDLAVDSDNNGIVVPAIDENEETNGTGAVVFVNSDNDNGNIHVQDSAVAGVVVAEDDLRQVVIDVGVPATVASLPGWSLKLKYDLPNKLNFYSDDKRANPLVDNDGVTLNPAQFFGNPKTIFVEGLDTGFVTLTLELKGPGNFTLTDQVQVRVLKVDADVDSDNSAGPTGLPSPDSNQEENLEMSTEDRRVGKYVPANHDDLDEDSIAVFHDVNDNTPDTGFTPLLINLGALDLLKFSKAKIKIEYPHYELENQITDTELYAGQTKDANDYEQQLSGTNTALRIWRKNEMDVRQAKDIKQNGDIVNFTEPTWYTADELGLAMVGGNLKGTLYIEGLHDTNAPSEIKVTVDFEREANVPANAPGDFSDSLLVKVSRIDMDIDSDNTQNDLALPERKTTEDILEAHTNKPGKIIYSNILNQDGDAKLDFEDLEVAVNGDLKFGYTPIQITFPVDMHNAHVRFSFEAGGVSGGFLTPGVRLWTKQINQSRNASSIALNGDLIPNDVWFDVSKFNFDIPQNSDSPERTVTIYVEGLGATLDAQNESRPTAISVEIDPVIRAGNGPNENLGIYDTVMVTVTSADIDVDSDNTSRYGLPERNAAEEQIEHLKNDPQRPGKYVLLNQRNTDNDGFLDSFDNLIDGGFFTPIVIQKPKSPASAGGSGSGGADGVVIPDYRFKLNYRENFLKLWNADANEARTRDSVSANGNIVNSNTSYTWAQLGGVDGEDTLVLYVEGLDISPAVVGNKLQGQEAIKLEVYEYSAPESGEGGSGGSGSTQLVSYDEVVVNVVNEVSVAVINKYAMEPTGTSPKAWELIDPAEFRISRGTGNTSGALTVYFQVYLDSNDLRIASLSDYSTPKINRTTDVTQDPNGRYYRVDIPEGQYFVDISFFPSQDSQAEWDEEIRLNLVQNPEYFVDMDIDKSLQNVPYNGPVPTKPFYYLAGQPPYGANPNKNYPKQVSAYIIDSNSDIAFPLNRNRDVESTGLTPATQSNGTVAVGLQSGDVTFVLPLAPGGWGPTYNSDDNLRPLLPIQIDIPYGGTPTEISVKLNVGGIENDEDITFSAGSNGFPTSGSGYNFMVMAQESLASKLSSGHYDYFATFKIKVGGETFTRTIRGKTEIVNRVDNALGMTDFGKRWWPEMLDRMIPTDGVNAINGVDGQELYRTQQGLAAYFGQTLVRGDNTTAFYHGYNPVAPSEINNYIEFTNFQYPSETDDELSWRTGLQLSSAGKRQDEDQASWALSGLVNDKQYQIYVTWEPGLDRASNAAYTMSGLREVGNTYSEDKTIIVSQRFTPGELIKNGKAWRLLGTYVATGAAEVILSTNSVAGGYANGLVHAGEVMVVSDWTYETPDGSYNYLNQGEMDANTNGYYKGQSGQTSDDLTLLAKTGTRYTFDEFGFLTLVQDRNENQTSFAYSEFEDANDDGTAKRLLETITSQGGLVTQYIFDEEHLDKILDFAGRETDYDIVGGLLEAIHEPSTATNSPVTYFAYFGQNEDYQLKTVTNARGDKTEIEYDSIAHRAKKITNPDSVGNPHSAQTINGSIIFGERAWQVRPDFVSSITSATAGKVLNEATGDLANNTNEPVAKYTDALNNVWRYQLDQFGGVIFSSDPVNGPGVVWKTERRARDGLAKKLTEPAGGGGAGTALGELLSEFDYDQRGNLISMKSADDSTQSWTFSPQFSITTKWTDQLGRETNYVLDPRGNLVSSSITSNSNPADGQSQLALRLHTTYTATPGNIQDVMGGLVTLIREYGGGNSQVETKYEYYEQGNEVGLVRYEHRAFGSTLQETTEFTYDPNRNLDTSIEREINVTNYVFDDLNRLVRVELPDGLAGGGKITVYDYDAIGNLTYQETVGIAPQYFTYDGMNRLVKVKNGFIDQQFYQHDATGNIVETKRLMSNDSQGNKQFALAKYEYDARGLRTKEYTSAPNSGSLINTPERTLEYDVLGNLKYETTNRFKLNGGQYSLDPNASSILNAFSYDELGRLSAQVLNGGSAMYQGMGYVYYADGMLKLTNKRAHDGTSDATNYEYDDFGRLSKLTLPDPDGGEGGLVRPITTYKYYNDGHLRTEYRQDSEYHATDYTYDLLGRIATKTLPEVSTGRPKWEYNYLVVGANLQVTETDPRGNDTVSIYDANGRLRSKTSPENEHGKQTVTTYEYFAHGGVKNVSTPFTTASNTQAQYATAYTYDFYGYLKDVIDPLGTTTYQYDDVGHVIEVFRYQNSVTNKLYYDYHGNLVQETDPLNGDGTVGPGVKYQYDTAGNRTKVELEGHDSEVPVTMSYSFDSFDRLISVTDPLGQTTTHTYRRNGELASSTTNGRTNNYTYDRLGRMTESKNALGEATTFAYDVFGRNVVVFDPSGNMTRFWYDALDRKYAEQTSVQTAYKGALIEANRAWEYDANGNVVSYTNRDGQNQVLRYDALNQLVEENWTDSDYHASWSYNELGQVLHAFDLANDTTISDYSNSYYANGLLQGVSYSVTAKERTVSGSWGYEYNQRGQRTSAVLGTTEFGDSAIQGAGDYALKTFYGEGNRISQIRQYDSDAADANTSTRLKAQSVFFSYYNNGQLSETRAYAEIGNANNNNTVDYADRVLTTKYAYNDAGQIANIQYLGKPNGSQPNSQGLLMDYDYTYVSGKPGLIFRVRTHALNAGIYDHANPANNVLTITDLDHTYDATGQLTQVSKQVGSGPAQVQPSSYGPNGQNTNYVYGADNRVFYDGRSWYQYDLEGRRILEKQSNSTLIADDSDSSKFTDHPYVAGEELITSDSISVPEAVGGSQSYWSSSPSKYFTFKSDTLGGSSLPIGSYRISVTWTALTNFTEVTDAQIIIRGINSANPGGVILAQRTVDQSKQPHDQSANGLFYGYLEGNQGWLGITLNTEDIFTRFEVDIKAGQSSGNLIADAVKFERIEEIAYSWDPHNRMVKAVRSAENAEPYESNYTYDVYDRLIATESGTNSESLTTTRYRVYDNEHAVVIVDVTSSGTQVSHLLWQPSAADRLLSIASQDTTHTPIVQFTVADASGTLQRTYSDSGSLSAIANTDPVGRVDYTLSNRLEGFAFAGQEIDPFTGLQYSRARWYDGQSQTFVSQDPLGFAAGDMNLYRRAGNNPVNHTDPSGKLLPLIGWGLWAGATALLGTVAYGTAKQVENDAESMRQLHAQANWGAAEYAEAGRLNGAIDRNLTIAQVAGGAALGVAASPLMGPAIGLGARGLMSLGMGTKSAWATSVLTVSAAEKFGTDAVLQGGFDNAWADYKRNPWSNAIGLGISTIANGWGALDELAKLGTARGRIFGASNMSRGEVLFPGGPDAAHEAFDPMLQRLFKDANLGEFQGIYLNREVAYSQFDDKVLAIYFRRNADATGRVVGEEVQHAIDFTMGATRRRIAAEADARGILNADLWWHRRVFTRQLQNINANQYGMGILNPYMDDVYKAYQMVGGQLPLNEILTRTFNGLY
jgi:RHS repeat-associated protein